MTRIKTALAVLVLIGAPGWASAACSGHSETAQISCAEGTTFNPDTNLCEPLTTG